MDKNVHENSPFMSMRSLSPIKQLVLLEGEKSQPQPNHETHQFQVGLTNTQWSPFLKLRLAIVVKQSEL